MVEGERKADSLKLEAGKLCLDFANTAQWHASDNPQEYLTSYSELVSWSQHAGIVTEEKSGYLLREATQRPGDATSVLEQAIALREAIYRIFSAIAHSHPPDTADITALNAALSDAMARSMLIPKANEFVWGWPDDDALDQMLWRVTRSAAVLLTSQELNRVGECADDRGCGWLFLDMSRNRSRRWCDMNDCGNRAKARRNYYRKRRASP